MFDRAEAKINAATRLCAVFGHPIQHSASPAMQNAGMEALGLNWRYLAFDVRPEQLGTALAGAKAMRFIGVNLTVPHKLLAVDMVDKLDESASTWGAVNTVRLEAKSPDGQWVPLAQITGEEPGEIRTHGFNTDADALARALREDLELEPKGAQVLLLGAGGAGRVAALRLASEGVGHLFLVNRTANRAVQLSAEIQRRYPGACVTVGYPKQPVDLILNATSVGLDAQDGSPLEELRYPLGRARAVYDMIYRPAETALLRAAKAAGCKTANGLGMLLYQGAKALELWCGTEAPLQVMRRALEKNIYGS